MTLVTAGKHLMEEHWIIANTAHIATRTRLPANHPVRKLLKVFTYNTGSINISSTSILAPSNALLIRMTGFTVEGYESVLNALYENYRYQTLPDFIESKKLTKNIGN